MMPEPFSDLPVTPETHFQLGSYAAVAHLLLSLARTLGSLDAVLREWPFLNGYHAELQRRGLHWSTVAEADAWWQATLHDWAAATDRHLPLRAVGESFALDHDALTFFITIGLVEEDARFGALFDALQGTAHARPTLGLLGTWWATRPPLRTLQAWGLIQIVNPEAPRSEQVPQIPAPIWEAIRGEVLDQITPWARYHSPDRLGALSDVIVPATVAAQLKTLPTLLQAGQVQTVIVRGPQHNGRHTLLGAVARELQRGVIEIDQARNLTSDQWSLLNTLAVLLHAMPVAAYDLAPGESVEVRGPIGLETPLGLVLSTSGGLTGQPLERAVTINLPLPDRAAREQHWQRAARAHPLVDTQLIAQQFRLTSGNIYRAAPLAAAQAALNGCTTIAIAEVQLACRTLHRQALETLATRLDVFGDWSQLAVSDETRRDLLELEARCYQRERLPAAVGAAFGSTVNTGVRALFTGPSGTGKTLAARVLAAQLKLDVYRVDLAAVVNKYIGETEKNLNQVLARAEELDVILLIDEGDALLTQRTNVSSSNDRYANLETNFLLQRLESFSGIVIITTNSSERIDRAFQRRMDVVIDFRPPEAAERWVIWQLHLPATHTIDQDLLDEVTTRCALTGGQIRNAALHATLLAVNNGGIVTTEYLEEAVKREYRQAGAVCPLRPFAAARW